MIALPLFQEAGVLDMEHPTLFVKNNKNGESETAAIVQPFHQGFPFQHLRCPLRLTRIVVHMDILKVRVNNLADSGIVRDEVCKAQTPGTPVTTHLTDDKLTLLLSLRHSLIYLLNGVDIFVIHLFQACLGMNCNGQQNGQKYDDSLLHKYVHRNFYNPYS